MSKRLQIGDVMTPFPHSVGIDQPITVAQDLLKKHGIRHLPVQKGGTLIGVVSERDIKVASALKMDLTIEDIYTPEPYCVAPKASLQEVAANMAKERIGCALIEEKGKLAGIFTAVDACRVLGEILSE